MRTQIHTHGHTHVRIHTHAHIHAQTYTPSHVHNDTLAEDIDTGINIAGVEEVSKTEVSQNKYNQETATPQPGSVRNIKKLRLES